VTAPFAQSTALPLGRLHKRLLCKASQSTPSATQTATQESVAQQPHHVRTSSVTPLHRYSELPNEAPSSQKLLPLGTVWQQSHQSRSTKRVWRC